MENLLKRTINNLKTVKKDFIDMPDGVSIKKFIRTISDKMDIEFIELDTDENSSFRVFDTVQKYKLIINSK